MNINSLIKKMLVDELSKSIDKQILSSIMSKSTRVNKIDSIFKKIKNKNSD
jgi:hypothetical protein